MVASPPVSSPSAPESSATISTANFPVLQHFFMAYSGGGKKLVAAKLVPFTLQPLPSTRVASSGSLLHAKRQRNVAKRKLVDRGNVDGLGVVGNQENGAINLSVKDNLERNNNNNDDDHRSSVSVFDGSEYLFPDSNVSDGGRDDRGKKRRRQTSVPEQNKDQRYWVRRLKNNEAAKRSRDMRIQREKILFDENARLEARSTELLLEKQQLLTDNKELQLKMDLILGENARLKATVQQFQHQDFEFIPSGSASQSPP